MTGGSRALPLHRRRVVARLRPGLRVLLPLGFSPRCRWRPRPVEAVVAELAALSSRVDLRRKKLYFLDLSFSHDRQHANRPLRRAGARRNRRGEVDLHGHGTRRGDGGRLLAAGFSHVYVRRRVRLPAVHRPLRQDAQQGERAPLLHHDQAPGPGPAGRPRAHGAGRDGSSPSRRPGSCARPSTGSPRSTPATGRGPPSSSTCSSSSRARGPPRRWPETA